MPVQERVGNLQASLRHLGGGLHTSGRTQELLGYQPSESLDSPWAR